MSLEDKCPECGSSKLINDYDAGEVFCLDCGLVIQDVIMDKGPEWRAFTGEEKESRSRVGVPTSYSVHDKDLSTWIMHVDRDALGRKLPLSTRLQMWRLKKWQYRSRAHSSIQRNLIQAMAELDRLFDKVSVPKALKEKAAVIYRKVLDKNLVQGRSIAAIVAASLYAACRINGTPRRLEEIAEASLVNKKNVSRCYRLLQRELDIRMPVPDPRIYLPKIVEMLNAPGKIQTVAEKFLGAAKKYRISAGKSPQGIAAAALYLACVSTGERKTQDEVAEAAGVTAVTVRNRYKELLENPHIYLLRIVYSLRIINRLNIPNDTHDIADEILSGEKNKVLKEWSPNEKTAAVFNYVCKKTGVRVTTKEIAKYSQMAEDILINRCKQLEKYKLLEKDLYLPVLTH